mmetsp:Transcript_14670/g.17067  ORF Transcript_14670/g.17067 Transcript_14670/m.17067 type:complete len:354 (-) Transcript_14670:747-1808(-)
MDKISFRIILFNFVFFKCFTKSLNVPSRRQQRLPRPIRRNNELKSSNYDITIPAPSLLTVILPAFNEELRIGDTIKNYREYLSSRSDLFSNGNNKTNINILVVDDGSTDNTCDVVNELKMSHNDDLQVKLSMISLEQNEGKGSAVARGILEVQQNYHNVRLTKGGDQGSIILVADADGSGSIQSLDTMIKVLWNLVNCNSIGSTSNHHYFNDPSSCSSSWECPAIVVGDRGYKGTTFSRAITRWGFRTAVKIICGDLKVSDSQCGLKLMTATAAINLYSNLNLLRWTHDVEVLLRAKELDIPITDTIIDWEDKDGSKLATGTAGTIYISMVMLLEIFTMRLHYLTGRWKVNHM